MVVLSASILTGNGKALVSRQFVEMNRMRVEGLLAAFPKLVGGMASQHTFVETDSVRYVYQPLENQMYVLLITTKASNIVEDLGTIRLLAKVVPDVAGGLQEALIADAAFEIIFAFDEVLTAGGYKEDITLTNIRTNLQMESHEEEVFLAQKQVKLDEAEAVKRQKIKELNQQRLKNMKENLLQNGPGGALSAMQGGGPGGIGGMEGFGGFGSDNAPPPGAYGQSQPDPEPEEPTRKVTGMKLGGPKKKDTIMAAIGAEDGFSLLAPSKAKAANSIATPVTAAPSTPLSLLVEEKLTVTLNREGGIESCEVKGLLSVTANTEAGSYCQVKVNKAAIAANCGAGWTVATHPKVDKAPYERQGLLALKGGKDFPVGRAVGVLKWSYSGEDAAPLKVTCWPEDEGTGSFNVNLEYELLRPDMTLTDVNIVMPLGTEDPPAVESIDGQYKHDPRQGLLCWHQDEVNSGSASGSMEFSIAGDDEDSFFPVQVKFSSSSLLCPVDIVEVTSSKTGGPLPNAIVKQVVPETYQCA